MDLDRELFEKFISDPGAVPILRIYRVSEPAVTVGRSYRGSSLPRTAPHLPVCMRPTGGGIVYHGGDLIYSVVARAYSFPTFHQVRTSYLSFHETVQEAFEGLGIVTRLIRCDDPQARSNSKRRGLVEECFRRPVPTDVALGDQKIAGGAQRRRPEGFLHQGSIQLPEGASFDALKGALVPCFQKKFGIVWQHERERILQV